MRPFPRAFTTLMVLLLVLSVPFSAVTQDQASPESGLLKADEGQAVRVDAPLQHDRLAPGLRPTAGGDSSPAAEVPRFRVMSHPREGRLRRGHDFHGDLRTLPQIPPHRFERPEFEAPKIVPMTYPGTRSGTSRSQTTRESSLPAPSVPAPSPSNSFEGLDFTSWGAGHPPDTNGDVGPQYYIQTINTSVGIYNKSDGTRVASFTFNTLMSQGNFGNLWDTNNYGHP